MFNCGIPGKTKHDSVKNLNN